VHITLAIFIFILIHFQLKAVDANITDRGNRERMSHATEVRTRASSSRSHSYSFPRELKRGMYTTTTDINSDALTLHCRHTLSPSVLHSLPLPPSLSLSLCLTYTFSTPLSYSLLSLPPTLGSSSYSSSTRYKPPLLAVASLSRRTSHPIPPVI